MNSFEKLVNQFNEIYKMGFVKSINNNKNSVGITIEKLLGSTGGDFNIPDFYDIEIKALRDYYKAEFDLFNSAPDGKYICASQWLSDKYGYPDRGFRNIRVFKGKINAKYSNKIGLNYSFKLEVDDTLKKIFLNVYDKNNSLISKDIYWDFDSLKDKLERKVSKLAIFGFEKKYINDNLHVHYNSLKLYKLKSFDKFIENIKKGKINVEFKTGVHKNGKYRGKFTDHGTSFRISKNNLCYLFDVVRMVWDKKKEQFVLN
ncbi:MAG: MvaI/BcnI restriction endonuclease family protein [Bacilli bacterium]|nr:MvaI/BcnI restriction endonuclease family protein [Bacilli bacterium]